MIERLLEPVCRFVMLWEDNSNQCHHKERITSDVLGEFVFNWRAGQ